MVARAGPAPPYLFSLYLDLPTLASLDPTTHLDPTYLLELDDDGVGVDGVAVELFECHAVLVRLRKRKRKRKRKGKGKGKGGRTRKGGRARKGKG